MNYLNENNPHAAAWLRGLIEEGLIPPGEVDERSITEIKAHELKGYTQHHFFAGIGGWCLGLEIAGWPATRPVWTGSPPCQPFSFTGQQGGFDDPRDLWPTWFRLVKKRKPDHIFGEQVDASPQWIDRAKHDLETAGYAFAPLSLSARLAQTKHQRQRLYFAANTAALDGAAHDRMVTCRGGRPSPQSGGLSSLHVAGRWWSEAEGSERLPTLVRQFNGLSPILGGFGNAIVPQVAAEFIAAYMDLTI